MPRFDPTKSICGEHYLEISSAHSTRLLTSTRKLIEVLDKGKSGISITATPPKMLLVEHHYFTTSSHSSLAVREDLGPKTTPGSRQVGTKSPDSHLEVQTILLRIKLQKEQAIIYRLTGDKELMHVDPIFSRRGGFNHPFYMVLYNGHSWQEDLERYGPYRSIKFVCQPVTPGQTLKIEMWEDRSESDHVVFQSEDRRD